MFHVCHLPGHFHQHLNAQPVSNTLLLDTRRQIATPEGVEIGLHIAGPVVRAQAWLLDFLIRLAIWAVLGMTLSYLGNFGFGVFLVCAFGLEWFYPVLFEVYRRGQTPGKIACGLAVVHDDGRPVGWGAAFTRNTLRFADFMPFLYAAGYLACLCNAEGKRLGDLAAGTVVIHVDPQGLQARKRKGDIAATVDSGDPGLGSEAPPFPLTAEEQVAVVDFSRRARQFTEERAEEIAAAATPLVAGLRPDQARLRLLRLANHFLGR